MTGAQLGLGIGEVRGDAEISPCVGPGNDHAIVRAVERASLVVAAWGAHEVRGGRDGYVQWLVGSVDGGELLCLGTTKHGAPRHPLYVRADTRPIPWSAA
jgi:hypothetical protein